MVEGESKEVSEEEIIGALEVAHEAIKTLMTSERTSQKVGNEGRNILTKNRR